MAGLSDLLEPRAKSPGKRRKTPCLLWLGLVGTLSFASVIYFAGRERETPHRCPEGLIPIAGRCCGEGQWVEGGHCRGQAGRCGPGMALSRGREPSASGHCQSQNRRIPIAGGPLEVAPVDWDGVKKTSGFSAEVAAFAIDRFEITWAELALTAPGSKRPMDEPGLPVTGIAPEAADTVCRSRGGRLPTAAEWLMAASGSKGRRYPWGTSGLVCRRAAFGLEDGPCAEGGSTPELVGSRPAGQSPDGVEDLIGNVAEWTREETGFAARGGSYRSRGAAELKTWSKVVTQAPGDDIGFRCVYELSQ